MDARTRWTVVVCVILAVIGAARARGARKDDLQDVRPNTRHGWGAAGGSFYFGAAPVALRFDGIVGWNRRWGARRKIFDSTLGYPGEGPPALWGMRKTRGWYDEVQRR